MKLDKIDWLSFLGEVDGEIFMACATWAAFDSAHAKLALLVGGLAGAGGAILKRIAAYLGKPDPVPQIPDVPAAKGGV